MCPSLVKQIDSMCLKVGCMDGSASNSCHTAKVTFLCLYFNKLDGGLYISANKKKQCCGGGCQLSCVSCQLLRLIKRCGGINLNLEMGERWTCQ